MPHKRAKRSVREAEKGRRGSDLAPSSSALQGDVAVISKRAAWVLGAEKVRTEWREKQKRMQDGHVNGHDGPSKKRKKVPNSRNDAADRALPLTIMPGETLGQFNRRIEDELRPGLRAAIKSSSSLARRARSDGAKSKPKPNETSTGKDTEAPITMTSSPTSPKCRMTKTEFDARPKMTRLSDVAMAPPALGKATRKAPERNIGTGVLSIEQKQELEAERERVVRRYREIKETKRLEYEGKKTVSVKRKWTDEVEEG